MVTSQYNRVHPLASAQTAEVACAYRLPTRDDTGGVLLPPSPSGSIDQFYLRVRWRFYIENNNSRTLLSRLELLLSGASCRGLMDPLRCAVRCVISRTCASCQHKLKGMVLKSRNSAQPRETVRGSEEFGGKKWQRSDIFSFQQSPF